MSHNQSNCWFHCPFYQVSRWHVLLALYYRWRNWLRYGVACLELYTSSETELETDTDCLVLCPLSYQKHYFAMMLHGNSVCQRETENSLSAVIPISKWAKILKETSHLSTTVTVQRVTKLKLPRPAKNLISFSPINLINTRVGEKRGQIMGKGAIHFLLDLK